MKPDAKPETSYWMYSVEPGLRLSMDLAAGTMLCDEIDAFRKKRRRADDITTPSFYPWEDANLSDKAGVLFVGDMAASELVESKKKGGGSGSGGIITLSGEKSVL